MERVSESSPFLINRNLWRKINMDIPEIPDNSLTKEINEIVEIAIKT